MRNFTFSLWRKLIHNSNSPKSRVNCWFCNGNFEVEESQKEQWTCPSCTQYNGFTEGGDYNKPITTSFEARLEDVPNFCKRSPGKKPQGILCQSCNQSQTLKVRQLASFIPLHENTYEEEISSYQRYLEHIYDICDGCNLKVRAHLQKQNKLFDNNGGDEYSDEDNHDPNLNTKNSSQGSKVLLLLPSALFTLTSVVSICLALLQLKSFLKSKHKDSTFHFMHAGVDSLLNTFPIKNITAVEQNLVYAGTIFCVLGLFIVGKYSLYAVDAIHVILWLLTFLILLALPTAFANGALQGKLLIVQRFISNAVAKLVVTLSTSLVAFICIFKSRHVRNVSSRRISLKPIVAPSRNEGDISSSADSEIDDRGSERNHLNSSSDGYTFLPSSPPLLSSTSFTRDIDKMFMPISSSPRPASLSGSRSPTSSKSMPSATVSGSARNDSKFPLDSENVRQDLETFTLGIGKRSVSSSSIWSLPSIVATASSSSQIPDSTQNNSYLDSIDRSVLTPSRLGFLSFDSSSSPNFGKSTSPLKNKLTNNSGWPLSSRKADSFTSYRDSHVSSSKTASSSHHRTSSRMPCDSSTHSRGRHDGKSSQPTYQVGDKEIEKPLRRSNRIAMQGKIIKPWPLKKSFSLNSMYDRKNAELAGSTARDGAQYDNAFRQGQGSSPSRFHSYRPTSAFRQIDHNLNSANRWTEAGLTAGRARGFRRRLSRRIEELSDDEEEEEEIENEFRKTKPRKHQGKSMFYNSSQDTWSTLTLILFGLIIGISITANAFLIWALKTNIAVS